MASINTAQHFGIKDQGAIAPGFKADFILLDDLESFKIYSVFIDGMKVERNNSSSISLRGYDYSSSSSVLLENTMHVKSLDNDDIFKIPLVLSRRSWIQVIGVTRGQIITEKRILQAKLDDVCALADRQRDIATSRYFAFWNVRSRI